mmetsp:Transcript_106695/g.308712  ORF Transcript_106695/g.308712 Transcript_106695/m.308712 type:complete len:255 (+) Transcript_106695:255-1019(+)
MPTERRTRSSGNVRFSAGIEAWLMVHGISIKLLTLPNDTVVLKILQASQKRRLKSTQPVVRLIIEPCPVACERCTTKLMESHPPRPGKYASLTCGCASKKAPTLSAFACARSTRKCIVLIPRKKRKHSKGARAVPSAFCRNATRWARVGSRTHTRPPVQSAWPEKNLVAEWITMSAPNVNGLQMTGGIIVLSTLNNTPRLWAVVANSLRSVIFILGFDGLSTWINFVCGVIAFLTAAMSVVSTNVTLMPELTQS